MSKEIDVGHVIIINLNDEKEYYDKRITIDFNGPYLSLDHFDKIREALAEILQKHGIKH